MSQVLEFDRFTLDRHRRELRADGRPVALGGRAFDVLLVLVDARGTVLSKDDLLQRVWPDRVVEENNLEAHISALRKALGAGRSLIRTVPRRGYQFTGNIRAAATAAAAVRVANLPVPVSELIGRPSEINDVMGLATAHRLVTLTGAGGIGKTRLALEAARRLGSAFPDGVFFADLAPLSSAAVVPVTAAASMSLALVGDAASPDRIGAAIGAKRILLVLDNCEHLIDAAAALAQGVLRSAAAIALLCTSREPLRMEGEHVFRVPPLGVPADDALPDEVLESDAVKLFVARARAAEPNFVAGENVAARLGSICRSLDGMPLAIELAAARIPSFGADGVASHLNDRFTLLTGGSRTALPRHQTLRATLDWSYDLLSPHERLVLRRLSVFAGAFTLEAAIDVVSGPGVSIAEVEDAVANLVTKSLLAADARDVMQYRLLETMREYALEKLRETGEHDRVARRHAEYYARICEPTDIAWGTNPQPGWMAIYGRLIENVRRALDWAFSATGDSAVGVALTAAAIPLWTHLALTTECQARVAQAIARLPGLPPDDQRDMRLYNALGTSLVHSAAIDSAVMVSALTTTLTLAERLDDTEYRLRALHGLYVLRFVTRDYRGALELAERVRETTISMPEPTEGQIGRRLVGSVVHIMGDQRAARQHIEPVLSTDFAATRRSYIVRYQWDPHVVAHCYYARILWLQGFVDRARRIADDVVRYAEGGGHLTSLLYALLQAACPIAIDTGDLPAADGFRERMEELALKYGLEAWAQCAEARLLLRRGESAAAARLMRRALDALPEAAFHFHLDLFRSELAEGLGAAGEGNEAMAIIGSALARAQQTEEGWYMPELLRKKGELLLRIDATKGGPEASACFREAIDVAHHQTALWWELRSATSLARLYHRDGLTAKARQVLAPVYRRFTEGFDTTDLVTAKTLLRTLR